MNQHAKFLTKMIKDRYTLSHVYKEEDYSVIYTKLPDYLSTLIRVIGNLESKRENFS